MISLVLRTVFVTIVLALSVVIANAETLAVPGTVFAARDTLSIGREPSEDATACLKGLVWKAEAFQVRCKVPRERCGDLMLQFPSPVASGDAANDIVTMEWYMARDEMKTPIHAPAVVVVHESGSGMTVGRMFARGLRMQGLHTFMIQLPYYGERRANGNRPSGENLIPVIRQAVADVRRARDAVASLPMIETSNISLQGTSLGGFVSTTAACLDDGYDRVFITLAGADLYGVIENGKKDAVKFREELERAGLTGDKLKSLVATIEPTRLAHRLDPETTWLYSAQFDQVVPARHAKLLATVAKLDSSHHITLLANHYSGVLYLPYILTHIRQQISPIESE